MDEALLSVSPFFSVARTIKTIPTINTIAAIAANRIRNILPFDLPPSNAISATMISIYLDLLGSWNEYSIYSVAGQGRAMFTLQLCNRKKNIYIIYIFGCRFSVLLGSLQLNLSVLDVSIIFHTPKI